MTISISPTAEINVRPAVVNIRAYQGDDVDLVLNHCDDLTQAIIEGQIRATQSDAAILAEFEITSVDGNSVYLHLSGADVAALPPTAVYDLQITWPDSTVETVIRGSFSTMPEVTR